MGTDADEVSHTNGWVSLVSDIKLGLAYLIDLPEKMQAKNGEGEGEKKKRQFLTEKASDRESLGLLRCGTAHSSDHTEASSGSGTLQQHGLGWGVTSSSITKGRGRTS